MRCPHRRKLHTFDVENKSYKGHPGFPEWLSGEGQSDLFSTDTLNFIVNDLVEMRENIDNKDKFITRKEIDLNIKIYKNVDKNSEEFKNAYEWLLDIYSDDKEDQRFVELDI